MRDEVEETGARRAGAEGEDDHLAVLLVEVLALGEGGRDIAGEEAGGAILLLELLDFEDGLVKVAPCCVGGEHFFGVLFQL